MDLDSTVEGLVSAIDRRDARKRFAQAARLLGISEAYFRAAAHALASDSEHAKKLASRHDLLLKYGDAPAYAHRTRAIHLRLMGKWEASAEAFRHAGESAACPLDRAVFQFGAVDSLARAGKSEEAVALGKALLRRVRRLRDEAQEGRLLINIANALLWVDDYSEARKWLLRAVPLLEASGLSLEGTYARLSLSTTELYGGHPNSALEHAEAVRTFAIAHELASLELYARLNKAQALLMLARADEALGEFLQLRRKSDLLSASDCLRLTEFLGDAYFRLNLFDEARDAYSEVIASPSGLPKANLAACHYGLGASARALQLSAEAGVHYQRAKRIFEDIGNRAWSAAAQVGLASVAPNPKTARALSERALAGAREAGSAFFEIEAALRGGAVGLPLDISRLRKLSARYGYVGFDWMISALDAKRATRGRKEKYRKAFNQLIEHRALSASTLSRASYFQDKQEVLSEYIGLLLARGSKEDVAEALRAISLSRSAALCDEIISSGAVTLSEEQRAELERLRIELAVGDQHPTSGESRLVTPSTDRMRSLQRRWIEAVHTVIGKTVEIPSQVDSPAHILYEGSSNFYWIRGKVATPFVSRYELERSLQWLKFEMLAPMADRTVGAEECLAMVADLGSKLEAGSWVHESQPIIAPEGLLWQVPWAAVAHSISHTCEPVLALHPSLSQVTHRMEKPSKVMLWVAEAQDLKFAARESEEFLLHYPDATVCRSAKEVREHLDDSVDLLHVVSHASHSSRNPMFSSFQFSDGNVFANDIARSGLRVKFASLSACETGTISSKMRSEPDGIARAMLACGAETVIGSMWPLDDEAATVLYSNFYQFLNSGNSVHTSLNLARKETRKIFPHPFFWASLVLFGGYST